MYTPKLPAKPAPETRQSPHVRHYLSALERIAEIVREGPTAEHYAERIAGLSAAAAKQRALMTDEERASIEAI